MEKTFFWLPCITFYFSQNVGEFGTSTSRRGFSSTGNAIYLSFLEFRLQYIKLHLLSSFLRLLFLSSLVSEASFNFQNYNTTRLL